ncbi:hypothetical protein TCAL_16099 [Tigriopus californicus]|uniref:Uncharacterized protein n=1 Tax=Tigriopus californicus TaxID=6832 RepID=A0A553PQ29_TIGCA|nr:hypothetical protein TCAL_16099 [Tigriopus californicus]
MDHFKDIYEPSWVMWAHLVGVFVFEILGSYLVLSIIRYEHERTTHETLIHSLTLFVYKMPIVHNMTRFNIEVARALLGPLPNLLCMTTVFFNIFLTIVSLLTFNEIMVLRYLYICVWKNVGKLNDDFFSAFLIVANLFLGSFFALVTMMSQDVQVFLYGVCIVLLALLTGALHCTLYVPIIREKSKRTDPMTSNQNGGQAIPIWAKSNSDKFWGQLEMKSVIVFVHLVSVGADRGILTESGALQVGQESGGLSISGSNIQKVVQSSLAGVAIPGLGGNAAGVQSGASNIGNVVASLEGIHNGGPPGVHTSAAALGVIQSRAAGILDDGGLLSDLAVGAQVVQDGIDTHLAGLAVGRHGGGEGHDGNKAQEFHDGDGSLSFLLSDKSAQMMTLRSFLYLFIN